MDEILDINKKGDDELVKYGPFRELEKRIVRLEDMFSKFTYELREEYPRYVGALVEDNFNKTLALFEGFNFKRESFERYMDGNELDKENINNRISRLEALK